MAGNGALEEWFLGDGQKRRRVIISDNLADLGRLNSQDLCALLWTPRMVPIGLQTDPNGHWDPPGTAKPRKLTQTQLFRPVFAHF